MFKSIRSCIPQRFKLRLIIPQLMCENSVVAFWVLFFCVLYLSVYLHHYLILFCRFTIKQEIIWRNCFGNSMLTHPHMHIYMSTHACIPVCVHISLLFCKGTLCSDHLKPKQVNNYIRLFTVHAKIIRGNMPPARCKL